MKHYYGVNNDTNSLQHYKYIQRYRSPKTGKWRYVYTNYKVGNEIYNRYWAYNGSNYWDEDDEITKLNYQVYKDTGLQKYKRAAGAGRLQRQRHNDFVNYNTRRYKYLLDKYEVKPIAKMQSIIEAGKKKLKSLLNKINY